MLTLSERETHHAVDVLRLRGGEHVVVLDGAGHEFLCEVRQIEHRELLLAVLKKDSVPPLPWRLTLLQAVPKGKTMDFIVEKATELGAHCIGPILSERTVVQVAAEHAAAKREKWQVT